MEHVAIDLGGQDSQICVRSSDGTVLEERRCPTTLLPEYLRARPKSRVVVETCSEAFGVADAAVEAGHEVVRIGRPWCDRSVWARGGRKRIVATREP